MVSKEYISGCFIEQVLIMRCVFTFIACVQLFSSPVHLILVPALFIRDVYETLERT